MIYDRTQQDVENAISIRENYVKKFIPLDDEQKEVMERGMLTINALNRIENKQKELHERLNEQGYYGIEITHKNWGQNDFFFASDMQRLVDYLNTLKMAFFVYSGTPATPPYQYTYSGLNDIEKILVDIENMLDDMILKMRECGTFECGEENGK